MVMVEDKRKRCDWSGTDPLYMTYHDTEWGVPLHDDVKLFEFLILEGAQAGLSWLTILRKRENYRAAFDNFDPIKVANYGENEIERLLGDEGIVRNKLKIRSAVKNAQAYLRIQKEFGSFDSYSWSFVNGATIDDHFETMSDVPANTLASEALSKDLKARGFKFVGPTIIYALMQASGMVNNHIVSCFRYEEIR
jgi:DNA-3-methyladenine glycosylase I